jgi:hypothetical protein
MTSKQESRRSGVQENISSRKEKKRFLLVSCCPGFL